MRQVELYKKRGKKIRCLACSHKCLIANERTGICGVRKNVSGKLQLLVYGKIAAMNVDPIEKKPLYHFMPKTYAFSIATVGCNFKCDWCQNFELSQISKTSEGMEVTIIGKEISAMQVVSLAAENKCQSIAYTYTEPIIAAEFYREIAEIARLKGLKNVFVTNGYFSKESLDYFDDRNVKKNKKIRNKSLIDAMNIDLKSFSDGTYRKYCGAKLKPVLETIKRAYEKGIHIEITTLVIPGINDSAAELTKIAKFIKSVDKKGNIPWHISRFFPMYKFAKGKHKVTPIETLWLAEKIGKKYLNYVYLGNV